MPVRRSLEVTTVAILLIVLGIAHIGSSVIGAYVMPHFFHNLKESSRQRHDETVSKIERDIAGGTLSPDREAKAREVLESIHRTDALQEHTLERWRSPRTRMVMAFTALLGVLMLSSGIGSFSLRPWVPRTVLVAAIAGLLYAGFAYAGFADLRILELGQQPEAQGMRVPDLRDTVMIFCYGYLIWFFRRPSVRAQFERA